MSSSLFSYRRGNTPLHRLPALLKLLLQAALCASLFASPSSKAAAAALLIACGGVIVAGFVAARVSVVELGRLRPILALGAIYAVFRVFAIDAGALPSDEGFSLIAHVDGSLVFFSVIVLRLNLVLDSLLYIYRFFMSSVSALVFFKTTSQLQIRQAFEGMERGLSRIFPPLRRANIALAIALAINFIPEIFSAWQRVSLAAKARAPEGKRAAFIIGSLYARLSALLSCLIRYAEITRRAILNRSAQDESA